MMEHKPEDAVGPIGNPSYNDRGNRVVRRTFFQWLTHGLSSVAAVVLGVPLIGYFVGVRKREVRWVTLGEANRFPVDETRLKTFDNPLRQPWDGMTALTGVYVRNLGADGQGKPRFLVFAVNCAHLGCPVSWFPQSGLFMCPCHGGAYYSDGSRASGPPERGLFEYRYKLEQRNLFIHAGEMPTTGAPGAGLINISVGRPPCA
jgi:menaquinol-cytochrome c reductase iron-sulfur subunit